MSAPLRVISAAQTARKDDSVSFSLDAGQNHQRTPIAFGALALLIVLLIAGLFMGRRQINAMALENASQQQANANLQQEVGELHEQIEALVAQQPTCDTYSGEIGELRRLVNQGQLSLVQGMADLYLGDEKRPACPEARRAMAKIAYSAALNDLFLAPVDDAAATERWEESERRADAHELPATDRMPPMLVVTQAYNAGLWELGKAAFLKAWEDGSVDQQSLKQVRLYYSILRNWGVALVDEESPDQRRAGLMVLRTANQISRQWGLSQGEAYQDLVDLLGPESQEWPAPDLSDPVLAAVRKRG